MHITKLRPRFKFVASNTQHQTTSSRANNQALALRLVPISSPEHLNTMLILEQTLHLELELHAFGCVNAHDGAVQLQDGTHGHGKLPDPNLALFVFANCLQVCLQVYSSVL